MSNPHDTRVISVGYGSAYLERDGEIVWHESEAKEATSWDDLMTFGLAKKMALIEKKSVWRIHLIGALSEEHFEFNGQEWVLYKKGPGIEL